MECLQSMCSASKTAEVYITTGGAWNWALGVIEAYFTDTFHVIIQKT